MKREFLTFRQNVFSRADTPICHKYGYFYKKLIYYIYILSSFSFVWVLPNVLVAITFSHEKHRNVFRGIYSHFLTFYLTFRSFWLSLIVFAPIVCLNDVYLQKDMIAVVLNPSLNVLLIFNMCQCLLIISLIFGIIGL